MTMPNESAIIFSSWRDFKDFIYDLQFKDDTCFRGQSNDEWGLVPSYFRYDAEPDLEKYFNRILPSAGRVISGYTDYNFDLERENDKHLLLGLLQHHGFPTPLLDWTHSPYIAAYFAFFNHAFGEPNCDHVAIWMLNGSYVIDYLGEKDGFCPFSYVEPNSMFNNRLIAQDGLFTLSKTTDNLDIPLSEAMIRLKHPGLLIKMIIPVFFAKIALNDLHLMGLHPGNLFPGIDGACKALMIKHFVPNKYSPGISDREWFSSFQDTLEKKVKEMIHNPRST